MCHEGVVCLSAQELCLDSQPPKSITKGTLHTFCVHYSLLRTGSLSSDDSVKQILEISHFLSNLLKSLKGVVKRVWFNMSEFNNGLLKCLSLMIKIQITMPS